MIFVLPMNALRLSAAAGDLWVIGDNDWITSITFTELSAIEEGETPLLLEAREQLVAYLSGDRKIFDLPLAMRGTVHQRRVWEALYKIPYGHTISYSALAGMVGGGTVARAVGTACGANPFPIVIPCHRVVASAGGLTGYLGGLEWKRWLLGLEGARKVGDEGSLFSSYQDTRRSLPAQATIALDGSS
jgi:methylated-DNA-[protein]-cysteine S-methyltransferase